MIEIPLEGDRILVLDNCSKVKVNGIFKRVFLLSNTLVLGGSQEEDTDYLELPVKYLGDNTYLGKSGERYVEFEV